MAERIAESGQAPRKIQRVPQHLKLKQRQPYVYDPMLVSIGPYHHGKPHLHPFELFKRVTVNMLLSDEDRQICHRKISERINKIRSCYVGLTAKEYDDTKLCEMMVHDACFITYCMFLGMDNEDAILHCQQHVGHSALKLAVRELNMLENQMPYWVIKLVINLRFGENEGKAMICRYLSIANGEYDKLTVTPWEEEEGEEPLHLLEGVQRLLAQNGQERELEMGRCSDSDVQGLRRGVVLARYFNRQFYSVTYLKAKGIQFKPSSTCLKDVRFESHALYGLFQLPIWFVSYDDYVFFNNMIAFEMCPGPKIDLVVTSYVNLMKTLIVDPKDVTELREEGILLSNLGSDMEIVKLFQEIDTMGVGIDIFYDVKERIQQHCGSKAKTWVAELISTYFRSPWTAIALFAATFIMVLTFLQTYTIRPTSSS